jgi:2-octaprenyl-6-methoxyphenol hydroxylase
MKKTAHIIVIGSGLAGATFIAAMASGMAKITLLERCLPDALTGKKDERPISLSYSSVILLKNLGLWDSLKPFAGAIQSVHVSEQDRFGSLTLNARDAKLDALGYVVPFYLLQETIYQYAMSCNNVTCISVNDIIAISEGDQVSVTFATERGEQTLQADKLVAADGMHSRCRELLHIGIKETAHNDVALAAIVQLARAHNDTAYERFTKQGVMALLPMWDKHQYRLVWTIDKALGESLTDAQLTAAVEHAFSSRIGAVASMQRMGHYPLSTLIAKQQVTEHCVLLGDSAHRIYPLAAQGYNLTVRDCATLVDVFVENKPLADYVTLRAKDQKFINCFTQSLEWVFGLQLPLLDHLRSTALLKMDLLTPVKNQLIQSILGRNSRQPALLCEE